MTPWSILAALLSGALLAVSRDTGQFGWLVLAAPVPLLVAALRAPRARWIAGLAFAAGLMAEVGPMWFYGRILPVIYGLAIAQALIFMLTVLFMRALYRRFPAAVAVLGFAVMTAAQEYLRSLVSPNGSFFALGYALVDVVPLLQTASLAGIAALYRPGAPVGIYLKKRMVPGLEAEYVPGTAELVTRIGGLPAGIAICKDMDFAQDLRLYGRRDVGLMLVPAWDFDRDAYLHGRMAIVRGVENGFAVARSASQGLMTLSDAHGRIVAERRTTHAPGMLVGDLPTGRGGTVYSRIGDVFGQGMVAAWLVSLALLAWRWRRVQASPARRM